MNNNICRLITLLNNQVPTEQKELKCDYVVFGEYDGILIGDNVFASNNKASFFDLWIKIAKETYQLEGLYTNYTLFLFRYDNDTSDDVITDSIFFSNKSLPFFFLTMIQYKEKCLDLQKIGRNIEKMIHASYDTKKVMAITYLTWDNTDIILLLKTNSYDIGKSIISDLHHPDNICVLKNGTKLTLNYSFSIIGFSKSILESKSDFSEYSTAIDEVIFNAIEKSPGYINYLYKNLINSFPAEQNNIILYEELGNDDNAIIWKNTSWDKLLPLYKENVKGIMSNENTDYFNSIYSVTTIIHNISSKISDKSSPTLKLNNENLTELITKTYSKEFQGTCQKYRETISKNISPETESLQSRKSQLAFNKILLQLLNALEKFERTEFPKYMFISIFEPLKQFLSLLKKNNSDLDSNTDLDFLNAINILIQNSANVDRNFFLTPDFNAGIYHLPAKLEAFYSAYIYYTTKLYHYISSPTSTYKFLLCPWMERQTQSTLIFPASSPGDRVILIKIPEHLLFNPKILMIVLGHEVGHYVGGSIRMRDKRYQAFLDILSFGIIDNLQTNQNLGKYISNDTFNSLFKLLFKELKKEEEKYFNDNAKEEKYRGHSYYMKKCFKIIVYNTLNNHCDELYQELISKYLDEQDQIIKNEFSKYSSFKDFANFNTKKLEDFQIKLSAINNAWNLSILQLLGNSQHYLDFIINNILSIFIESFADLINILALDLTPEAYLNSFFETITYSKNSPLTLRICFVIQSILDYTPGNSNTRRTKIWIEGLNTLQKENLHYSQRMWLLEILQTLSSYKKSKEKKESQIKFLINTNNPNSKSYNLFKNIKVWEIIIGYLVDCKEYYDKHCNNLDAENLQNELRDIYKNMNQINNIEEVIKIMDNLIYKYTQHVFDKAPLDIVPTS